MEIHARVGWYADIAGIGIKYHILKNENGFYNFQDICSFGLRFVRKKNKCDVTVKYFLGMVEYDGY